MPRLAEAEREVRQLLDLHRAALEIGGDIDRDRVLHTILRTAARLVHARYAALGVPDPDGGFGTFLTVGISKARSLRIGELPRLHGILGTLLREGRLIRLADITTHPRFSYYPAHHPALREFLGVPIRHRGEVLGELYLSDTPLGRFTPADQRAVEMLAAHAGLAIVTARLAARAQELAALRERDRVTRQVQDAVGRALVDVLAEARSGATERDPEAARSALGRVEMAVTETLGAVRALTKRERDVLRLMVEGLANKEIAGRLALSEKTVKTHVSSLLAKLGVADRTQAAVLAVRTGLVE